MNTNSFEARQAKLNALCEAFAADLPKRVEALTISFTKALTTSSWGDERATMLAIAHTLAGTAGSFGYLKLSASARQLEDLLLSESADTPSSLQKHSINELLENLRNMAAAKPDEILYQQQTDTKKGAAIKQS